MKGGKRLLSALLALAMVGQLGMIVVGSAADGTTDILCNSTDHGMAGHNVTSVGSCKASDMHWISNGYSGLAGVINATGNEGTSYLYPNSETTSVTCGDATAKDAKNFIIFESRADIPEKLEIHEFLPGRDKILFPASIFGSLEMTRGSMDVSLTLEDDASFSCKITLDFAPENLDFIGSLPTGKLTVPLENKDGQVTISHAGAEEDSGKYQGPYTYPSTGKYTYFRGTKAANETSYSNVTKVQATSPAPGNPGSYYYIVVENDTGRVFASDPLTVCSAAPEHITYNGNNVSNNQSFSLGADQNTVSYPFGVAYSDCNDGAHSGGNHGYTVQWSAQSPVSGVTVGGDGTVTLGAGLSTQPQTVTLRAVVSRGDYSQTLTIPIQVQKLAPNADPVCDKTLGSVTIQGLPQGPVTVQKTDTVPYSRSLTYDVTWTGGDCGIDEHTTNSYHTATAAWSVEGDPTWASIDGSGNLTLKGTDMPAGTNTVTVKVTVTANGGEAEKTATGTISVTRPAVCEKTIDSAQITGLPQKLLLDASTKTCTLPLSCDVKWNDASLCEITGHTDSHGQTVQWGFEGTAPAWATGIDGGRLTLDRSKLTQAEDSVTVKATVTAPGGSTTATATLTVSQDDAPITFGGEGTAEPTKEISVTSASAAEVSSTYTAKLPDSASGDYTYIWTLKKKNDPQAALPGYIKCTPKGTSSAVVTIIKANLPATGVNGEVFELTVTAAPASSTSTQNLLVRMLAAIVPLAGDPSVKVASYDITVNAAANSNGTSGSGTGSGSSGSGGSTGTSSSGGSGSSGGSYREPDYSNSYQWLNVLDDIEDAKRGSIVKVSLKDNTNMPAYIYRALQGKDISLQMKISGNYTWTVGGRSIRTLPGNQLWVPLGVETYSNSKMTALCRDSKIKSFQLENTESFYGDLRLSMNLGSSYAKKTVYLYSYNEKNNRLTYASSAKAADNGEVEFTFTESLGAYVITSKSLYGESAVTTGGGAVGGNKPSVLYPPVVSAPATTQTTPPAPAPESSGPAPAPAEPDPIPDVTAPAEPVVQPEPEQADTATPILVPLLILAIAGVIAATVVLVHNSKGRDDFGIDYGGDPSPIA